MNILPGEPVPPGFEDEINRVAEIQQAIDQYQGNALIGLEYTVELFEEDRREPGYYCVLCDKRGDPRNIMQHWTSFNHRMKYLERHFQTAVHEFNPVKYKPNSQSIIVVIVQKLAEAIEDHHGRLQLSVYSADDFRHMKNKIVNEVNAKFHYDERNGPNFVNVIDRTLWEKNSPQKKVELIPKINVKAPKRLMNAHDQSNRDALDEISSDSDSQDGPKKSKKNEQMPAYRILPRVRRSPPFEEERDKENDKALPTPKELSLQASHIAQERYKWEKYRCLLELQLKQMRNEQEEWGKNPEQHPCYPEEWKKFWNRRYKELQAEKKVDPNKYDYKPEWIDFWQKRMIEIFNADVERKKKEIKVKLGLPEDAEEKVDQLREKYKVQVARSAAGVTGTDAPGAKIVERIKNASPPKPRGRERKRVEDVIDISDDDSPRRPRRSRSFSRSVSRRSRSISPRPRHSHKRAHRSASRSKSPSVERHRYHNRHRSVHSSSATRSYPPTEGDYYAGGPPRSHYPGGGSQYPPHYRVMDAHEYPKYDSTKSPKIKEPVKEPEPEPEDEGPLTVVAVLRLLTALEEHLGSLGPKAVDMLGKALALEKVKANSSDEVLLNDDHCVFFETIKEKLKGLLIADVVQDPQKVRATKKAVKNIAAIIYQVNTKGKEIAAEKAAANAGKGGSEKNSKSDGDNANLRDLPFERSMVAKQLAAALVVHGREDVTTGQMDKLIWLYLIMAKLQKLRFDIDGKPLLMNDVAPELGITLNEEPPPSNNVDDNIDDALAAFAEEAQADFADETTAPDGDTVSDANSKHFDSLTDSDLQTLLQNFKHLSTEEQHHLIAHLKKLEKTDVARVEKLRKYVNFTEAANESAQSETVSSMKSAEKERQAVSRNSNSNTFDDDEFFTPSSSNKKRSDHSDDEHDRQRKGVVSNPNKFSLDDDDEDDDYTYDEVFKAASSNVKRLSESKTSDAGQTRMTTETAPEPIVPVASSSNALKFNPAGLMNSLPADTQNIIASLMGSLHKSNTDKTAAAARSAPVPQPVPAVGAVNQQPTQNPIQQPAPQQLQPNMMPANTSYYQQGQQHQQYSSDPQMQAYAGGYNQQGTGYYNQMGDYNNMAGYGGYSQWGNAGQQLPQQAYGMHPQQFGMQSQQQHQPPQPPMGGYNLPYGRR